MYYLATDKGFYAGVTKNLNCYTQDIRKAAAFETFDGCDYCGKYLMDGQGIKYYAILTSRI